jgi:hypothetical protein
MNRRCFLRVGGPGAAGITLPHLLRQDAAARESGASARPESVIYIVLDGGPCHIDMWDPKPDAGCAVFFGGGLKTGPVVGETDTRAERAKSGAISFQNVIATIYSVLGVDLNTALPDFTGRPQFVLDDNKPIKELQS